MSNISYLACIYGLNLDKKLKLDSLTKLAIKEIPSNTFGVFTSVERSEILPQYPENIHGCIGYWNKDFNIVSANDLVKNLARVSYQATWEDDRRTYFDQDINKDSEAKYKVYLMQLPIYEINENGYMEDLQKQFNNQEYGIIVVDDLGNTATYLPEVFPNVSWIEIKKSLDEKASISSKTKYYGYRCITNSQTIQQCLDNMIYSLVKKDLINWLNTNYGEFIPYELKNGVITIDKKEEVRNIATIYDFVKNLSGLKKSVIKKMKDNLGYYQDLWSNDASNHNQAMSFLLLARKEINKYDSKTNKNKFSNYLSNKTKKNNNLVINSCGKLCNDISGYEVDFELCEIGIGCVEVCKNKKTASSILLKIEELLSIDKIVTIDNIFRYNWNSKFLWSLLSSRIVNRLMSSRILDLSHKLLDHIFNICKSIELEKIETNYLAVILEALENNKKIIARMDMNDQMIKEINNWKLCIFSYLVKNRYQDGLYQFMDGTSRIDITGHVLNSM